MPISGKTRVYGLLGDPVSHTLSPLIQNSAFQKHGIDAVYVSFHVQSGDLPAAVDGIRALDIAGANVTIPYKEAIIPLLDQIDPSARLIGAVNTIVINDGSLIGYNTDASGFMNSIIQELGFQPTGQNVLLLGAGGACRAAAVALASAGVKSITIANRSLMKAKDLTHTLSTHFSSVQFSVVSYRDERYMEILSTADLVVNTTSVGLHGEKLSFFPLERIKGGALIFDMIYSSSETPLIRSAHLAGLRCVDGRGMLAAQGEDAFYLWTGIRLPYGFMRQILELKNEL